jgi:hypothetical protein
MPDIVGRLRTPRLPAAPSSPAVGEVYYDTSTNILYWWNGTSWVSASGGGAGSADLVYNGAFPTNTPYTDGDIVVSGGVAYMCVRPTSATPTPWSSAGAGDLVYNGAFPSNTPYTDGDIVLQNGIAYLCVRPTSAAPTPWPRANAVTSYNTSLPTSPVDGQEAVLVDSVTNPSYIWRFRYNAGSTSAYKWEFVGGAKYNVQSTVSQNVAVATPTVVPPSLTLPRAGDYDIAWGARIYQQNTGGASAGLYIYVAGVQQTPYIDHYQGSVGTSITLLASNPMQTKRLLGVAASVVVDLRMFANVGTATSDNRWIEAIPVRVS